MANDHLSDFIIRFKNRKSSRLTLFNTKKTKEILNVLRSSGHLKFKTINENIKTLELEIEFTTISSLKLISKKSRAVYKSYNDLLTDPLIRQKVGFYILSNSEHGWITSSCGKKVGGNVVMWVSLNG
jgi:ribosomal protein S8